MDANNDVASPVSKAQGGDRIAADTVVIPTTSQERIQSSSNWDKSLWRTCASGKHMLQSVLQSATGFCTGYFVNSLLLLLGNGTPQCMGFIRPTMDDNRELDGESQEPDCDGYSPDEIEDFNNVFVCAA